MKNKFICLIVFIILYQIIFILPSIGKDDLICHNLSNIEYGNTLIVDKINDRIIEVNESGVIIWKKILVFPYDAERLYNSNSLLTNHEGVIEVNSEGGIVWSYSTDKFCTDAERLANGNTLITDYENDCIIEVDNSHSILWSYSTDLVQPWDAERLINGNTLISNYGNDCVIEVNSLGAIEWSYSINDPTDVERLENGNTLITNSEDNYIVEVDRSGDIVWDYSIGLNQPWDAERLANGNTLIADRYHNRIIEVDNSGSILWSFSTGINRPIDVERILPPNEAPYTPEKPSGITQGKPGNSCCFNTTTVDPNGDQVKFGWDWDGDDIVDEWSGYLDSGDIDICVHIWNISGTYNIKVKAEDIYGAQSGFSLETVVKISDNNPPNIPNCVYYSISNEIALSAIDPDDDDLKFGIDWDEDRIVDDWTLFVRSGSEIRVNCEGRAGPISVIAEDIYGAQSEWNSVTYRNKLIYKILKIVEENLIDFYFLHCLFKIYNIKKI